MAQTLAEYFLIEPLSFNHSDELHERLPSAFQDVDDHEPMLGTKIPGPFDHAVLVVILLSMLSTTILSILTASRPSSAETGGSDPDKILSAN